LVTFVVVMRARFTLLSWRQGAGMSVELEEGHQELERVYRAYARGVAAEHVVAM
jgi:hypothetical protein